MDELEPEQKAAVAELRMGDGKRSGARPMRQAQPQPPERKEIAGTAEHERACLDMDRLQDGDAEAEMLLEPRRSAEPLRGMDHLRECAPARVEPAPDLPVAGGVLGHGNDAWHVDVARGRQRRAD